MKKSIMLIPIFISLSIVGCAMNYTQPSSEKIVHQTSLNIDKLMNANVTDIEKSLGSPYYATYYIDADSLKNKNINAISMEDLKSHVSALASYKDNEVNNSYLHVYYENGIVKDAFSGPYKMDNLDNTISASNISKANYKVSFFRNHGAICSNDFSINTAKKEFIGKSITDFNKYYNVESANFVASTINESETLYFYPLVDHNIIHKDEYKHPNYGSNDNANLSLVNPLNNNISQTNKANSKDLINYYKSAVVLHVKDDKIQSMQIADNQFLYKLVEDVLSSK